MNGRWLAAELIDSLTLATRMIPQFATVALSDPQRQIDVLLDGPCALDVSVQTVAVSLDPLLIAVGVPATVDPAVLSDVRLVFRETAGERTELARLDLRFRRALAIPGGELAIFSPIGERDRCLRPHRLLLYYGWKRWYARRRSDWRGSFDDFKRLLVYYVCPRPVALVSVMDDAERGNLFPMDLIASPFSGTFVAALKNTNRALECVRRSRRMVVSVVPYELADQTRALADMHRADHVDWSTVPVALARSACFAYPVPERALTVTEIEVQRTEDMGSHTALIGVQVRRERLNEGRAMHHVSGLYQTHCRMEGHPL